MRVVCIDSNIQLETKSVPSLVKGNIYHVIEERYVCDYISVHNFKRAVDVVYYNIIENGHWYHCSLFVKVNDIEIDETELVKYITKSIK